MILDSSSICTIKKLTVEKGGTVIVKSGAILALEAPEHIINGNLLVGEDGGSTARIIGKLEEHCFPSDDPRYMNMEYMTTQPVIYMSGKPDKATILMMQEAECKNISINAMDVTIPQPFDHVDFYSNTRLTNPYFNFDYLLSISYDECSPQQDPISFISCTFRDSADVAVYPAEPDNWNKRIFRTGGAMISNAGAVVVEDCEFENLEYGISAYNGSCSKLNLWVC